ncbi:hypothetical protein F2Q68_00008456 [Brassica cretica]|uniref:DUF1985 domain-containing protein n=1 Tax=Brassica cretica TaxID=69181 RepID=A0A8S9KRT1_BRACR|nr:hypothetical protein F2Q68_00008456 [Brassica cretica]
MVTGLKCNGEVEGPRGEYEWELLKGRTHKLSDVLNQLKKTRVDASDERVCLAMLLLVESILLPKNNKGTFPLEYVNKAKDMMYPWGREAYLILESIPLLRDKFSNWAPTVDVPGRIYLCEKYTELENPSLERLKVTCILPPIPHDPEDDVSMEDEHSDKLESVKDISKKGYKFKADDWKNRSVDTLDTLDALIHMTEHVETSQASASIEEDSENTKLNKIIELMMENAKRMKDRMSLLEAENMEHRARVSELEGNQNVVPHIQTPVFPTNVTQQRSSGTPLSPMSQQPETPSLQTQEFSPNLPRELYAQDITGREPFNETPSLQTQEFSPNLPRELLNTLGMTFPDFLKTGREPFNETPSLQTQEFSPNLPRESGREPLNETPSLQTQEFSPNFTPENDPERSYVTPSNANEKENLSDEDATEPATVIIETQVCTPVLTQQVGTEATNETPVSPIAPQSIETPVFTPIQTQQGKPVVGMKRKATAHPVDHAKKGKPVVGMKRKETAQPVDRLAFLQREEKRPIVPRNPPMPVTPEVILPIDPFVTPEFPLFSRHGYWMQLCGIHYVPLYINGNKIEKDFFEYLDYVENNLKEKKPDKKGINILKGWVGEVVRGLIRPNNMWMQDVDIVYGVVHERLVDHFIGVEIHLMENTITIFHCGVHKVKENPLIQKLADVYPEVVADVVAEACVMLSGEDHVESRC